jgi:hypothetical protein
VCVLIVIEGGCTLEVLMACAGRAVVGFDSREKCDTSRCPQHRPPCGSAANGRPCCADVRVRRLDVCYPSTWAAT